MTELPESLTELRSQIDRIDHTLHDLFMERARVVSHIAAAKSRAAGTLPGPIFAMRPGREARILRRLAERHEGELPRGVIGRIWRELISANSRLQGPFQVAVYGSRDPIGFWDVARSHFGSNTPTILLDTAGLVLRRVAEETGMVGVLPAPGIGDSGGDWWPALTNIREKAGPQIVARLPFFRSAAAPERDALAVARVDREETGDDRTYLAVHCPENISRASVQQTLLDAAVDADFVDASAAGDTVLLFDAAGYIIDSDPRLEAAREALHEAARIIVIGGYAVPCQLPD